MPVYSKIPLKVKEKGAIAGGHWAVYCDSIITASRICRKLNEASKKGDCPLVGYVTSGGTRYYYCRYGFINDPDIYK